MSSSRHDRTAPLARSRLLSVSQAAELLTVTPQTIRNWIAEGAIPCIELPAQGARRRYRIPVQGLLNAQTAGEYPARALKRLDGVGDLLETGMLAALRRGERRPSPAPETPNPRYALRAYGGRDGHPKA